MKKIVIIVALIGCTVFIANSRDNLKAIEEFNNLPGNTPYKIVYPALAPDNTTATKVIAKNGDVIYYEGQANVNLETGELN